MHFALKLIFNKHDIESITMWSTYSVNAADALQGYGVNLKFAMVDFAGDRR